MIISHITNPALQLSFHARLYKDDLKAALLRSHDQKMFYSQSQWQLYVPKTDVIQILKYI